MTAEDNNALERVYTMTDYYDGPRAGIADYRGKPHAYSCPFDYWKDAYTDLYELRPVDAETLQLALEDWEIWLRWNAAFKVGEVDLETHPALPIDRARHDEIAPILDARLALGAPIRVRGVFRSTGAELEVRWAVTD